MANININNDLELPEDVTTVTVDDNNNRKKRRSEVWEHFTFANGKAKCKHCIG